MIDMLIGGGVAELAAWEAKVNSCYLFTVKRILAQPGQP